MCFLAPRIDHCCSWVVKSFKSIVFHFPFLISKAYATSPISTPNTICQKNVYIKNKWYNATIKSEQFQFQTPFFLAAPSFAQH
ncbi:hypothetical protein COCCADRAFT_104261 [Bipolaris zeicola 26-R-13]|uniref:Uncharacterized protein n=1 Tax=Cochliobolus carbonum (strain 26-R-13) TaxID=930089 RepID=W6XYB5_COCC2|nr:uncharacterized protein COCCADRAFT_104261 [Bipolaris zeicola 26-R-13]EUC30290.1 hypothetical protein COCCADRAFT_104261 [Bipolaris zeicola 26-R-13]